MPRINFIHKSPTPRLTIDALFTAVESFVNQVLKSFNIAFTTNIYQKYFCSFPFLFDPSLPASRLEAERRGNEESQIQASRFGRWWAWGGRDMICWLGLL